LQAAAHRRKLRRSGELVASVFLSYARQDVARVRSIVAALERAGHAVWWDEQISGGDQYADAIERALDTADAVVVLWTSTSVKSAWVRDEAATARDSGRLVPVTLDGTQPPLGFRQFQTIDLSRRAGAGAGAAKDLDQLTQAIARRAGTGDAGPVAKPRSASLPAIGSQRSWLAGGAVALIAAGGAGFYIFSGSASAAITPKVALGSFATLSATVPRQLQQTMNEEILSAFGTEHEVAVLTGNQRDAPFVLDGSIQNTGEALRFTVNLRNVRTGGLVWSHSFDRALEDSLAPRQVAVAATQIVRCGIWGASAYRKPMSDQGLSRYVDWCNEYWGGSPDEDRILDAARRVSAALPDFSFAWSALALSAVPVSHRAGSADAAKVGEEGLAAAKKSIRLDARNPEGYMAEAGLLPSGSFAERERLLEKAISVRPTECGCERQAYGDFLTSIGRNEESVDQYDRARAMMPLAPMSNVRLAQAMLLTGRADEAKDVLSNMLQVWPDAEIVRLLQVKAALWTGQYSEGVELLEASEVHLVEPERQALLHGFQALRSNNGAAAGAAVGELKALAADPRRNDRLIVAALAALKAHDEALAAAESLIRARGPALADVLFDPNLAAARLHPGYGRLVERLGLASYWRASGRLPDICRGGPIPAFCTSAGKEQQ
jgi:tetratricopeptide (TPR) repeat protein